VVQQRPSRLEAPSARWPAASTDAPRDVTCLHRLIYPSEKVREGYEDSAWPCSW
jgi:hypothetical protein